MFKVKGIGLRNVFEFAREALGKPPCQREPDPSEWYPGEDYFDLIGRVGEALGGGPEVYREMGAYAARRAGKGPYRLLFSYVSTPVSIQAKKDLLVRLYYQGVRADAEILAPGKSRIYLTFPVPVPEFYLWFLEGWIGEVMRLEGAKRVEVKGQREEGRLRFDVSWEM